MVEDNSVLQTIQKTLLIKWGHQVRIESNGQQAIDNWQAHQPQIILMDVQMPIIDGLAATQAMRQQGCTLPIIALTGNDSPEERETCLAAGMDGFLAKPMTQAQFNQVVSELNNIPD